MKGDWEMKKVGELFKTSSGGTPLKSHVDYYENGDIPWLVSGEVNNFNITESKNFITKKGLDNSSAKMFPKDSVLVAMYGATAGQVGILRFEACSNQAVCAIYPNENFDTKFVYYSFLSKKNELISKAVGNAQPNISQLKIRDTEIPDISLPEQQKIVEILDTAFDLIDQAKSNIEKNIQNAKELFQSKLNEVFLQKGDGWEEKPLEKVAKTASGGTPLKSHEEYYENGNIPWLLSGEVNNRSITECRKFITQKGLENSSARIFPKDSVLVAMYGATAGQVGILRFEAASNQAVCAIFPNENFIVDFLYYNFLFKKSELIGKAVGNAQPNISQIKIKETVVAIVDLKTQQRIVEQLDQLSAQTEMLQKKYIQKLANLEELKKSILEKAFKGELVMEVHSN